MAAGGGMELPADFAAKLLFKANEDITEVYGEMAGGPDNVIAKVAKVRKLSEMNNGLFHRETMVDSDGVLQERAIGGEVKPGNIAEKRYAIHKRRFFARKYTVPFEMAQYVLSGMGGNALAAMERWASDQARQFGSDRFEAEQLHFAKLFQNGGILTGDDVFENSIAGVVQDPGNKLTEDGKPLFALSGNNHGSVAGTTYYNAIASNLTAANLETLDVLVGDTNGYSDMGYRMNTVPNLLVTGVTLRPTALRIVNAERLAGQFINDANPWTKYEVVTWPYITDTDAWFVGRAGMGVTWWQDDKAPQIDIVPDIHIRSYVLAIQSEFGAQVSPQGWKYWGASNLATS